MKKRLIILLISLFAIECFLLQTGQTQTTDAWIKKRRVDVDTTIVYKILRLPSGSYGTATLNQNGDSIKVFVLGGMSINTKILVNWHGERFLGELGIRNRTIEGFTIFSNTDEFFDVEVAYLLLDHKITLPLP